MSNWILHTSIWNVDRPSVLHTRQEILVGFAISRASQMSYKIDFGMRIFRQYLPNFTSPYSCQTVFQTLLPFLQLSGVIRRYELFCRICMYRRYAFVTCLIVMEIRSSTLAKIVFHFGAIACRRQTVLTKVLVGFKTTACRRLTRYDALTNPLDDGSSFVCKIVFDVQYPFKWVNIRFRVDTVSYEFNFLGFSHVFSFFCHCLLHQFCVLLF